MLSVPMSYFYQIGSTDIEGEKISADEEAEKPNRNKTSDPAKNDNRDTNKLDQKHEEESAKVKWKQSNSDALLQSSRSVEIWSYCASSL